MQQDNSSFWTDIKTFEEQLAKSPDSYCFARLSEVYLKVGLVDDALHTARQGVAKYPRYLGGQRALAMACHAKGFDDDCLAALKQVTEGMPEDHQSQKLLGRLLAATGDRAAARQAFMAAQEFVPDDVECRMELAALEVSDEPAPPVAATAEEDDEEIIEDLELLDEIEIIDEDFEDSAQHDQEQPPVAMAAAETPHDPLSTVTLAELYVRQGFIPKALEIYRSILLDDPGNSVASNRIEELETQLLIDSEPALAGDEVSSFEPDEVPETDFGLVAAPEDDTFAVLPEDTFTSAVPVQEEVFLAAPTESVAAVLKPQGVADNALSTLEGWLENARRLKSCR